MQFRSAIRRQADLIAHRLDEGGMDSEDESGLLAACQALRWVIGLDTEAPLDYNLPPAFPAVAIPDHLSPEQRQGLACAWCGRSATAGPPMVPLPVFGPLLIACADFCDSEVVGEVG